MAGIPALELGNGSSVVPAFGSEDGSSISAPGAEDGRSTTALGAEGSEDDSCLSALDAEDGRSIPVSPSDGSIPGLEDGGLAGIPAWGLEDGSSLPA